MELLKTSVVIKNMHAEEEGEEGEREIIDYDADAEIMFHAFAAQLPIHYACDIKPLLNKFNVMYKSNLFREFMMPSITEYFCKHLNYLLLIDFILSFFKIEEPSFNVQSITTEFIFRFFVQVSHVFNFANYLDLDEAFVKYLKSMLTLYLLQLDRPIIELHFKDTIPILDEFFVNEIFKEVYFLNIKNVDTYHLAVRNSRLYKELYAEELKDYDMSSFSSSSLPQDFVDPLFTTDYFNGTVNVITTRVYNESDDESDNGLDDDLDEDDYTNYISPYTEVKAIEETDPMYNTYKKMYICKQYHTYLCHIDRCLNIFKRISLYIKISSYDSFYPSPSDECIIQIEDPLDTYYLTVESIYKIKLLLGYSRINMAALFAAGHTYSTYVPTICIYGHLHLFKQIVSDTDESHLMMPNIAYHAYSSPNPELFAWLSTHPTYKKYIKNNYPAYKVPQIKFN